MNPLQSIVNHIPSALWLTQSTPQQATVRVGAVVLSTIALGTYDLFNWNSNCTSFLTKLPLKLSQGIDNLLKNQKKFSFINSDAISTGAYFGGVALTVSILARCAGMGITLKEASIGALFSGGLASTPYLLDRA